MSRKGRSATIPAAAPPASLPAAPEQLEPSVRRTPPVTDLLVAMLLAAIPLAVYAHVCRNGFVYDDAEYVLLNPHVLGGLSAADARWAFTAFYSANWHPLTWLSLQLDASLFGREAWGYHLHNLLLHTGNTVLLFVFLRRATGALWRSALAAALFSLHPLHVESVAWVAERKDVLSALLGLLALLAYLGYVKRPGLGRYLVVVLAFALGLLAKPMLVTLPCVLLLLDYWPLRRFGAGRIVGEKVPLLLLSAVSCVLTVQAQRAAGTAPTLSALPLEARLANAVLAYAGYLGKAVWPANLSVYYPYSLASLAEPRVLAAAALLLALTIPAVLLRRRAPYLLVGWLWYVGMLVPVIGLVQVGGQAMADRYTYLPLVGIFLALSWGLGDLAVRWRCQPAAAAAAVVALVACSLLTWLQVHYWQDEVSLWTQALEVEPNNPAACEHLGMACLKADKLDDAERCFQAFLQLDPANPLAHTRLGMLLARRENWPEAKQAYQRALALGPAESDALRGLGLAALVGDQPETAAERFRAALRVRPESAMLHRDLGLALEYREAWTEAAACYGRALELEPASALYHRELALALWQTGQLDAARGHYQQSTRLAPDWLEQANLQARLRLMSPQPQPGDGKAALHLARQLCQATGEREPTYLETLAAAQAEIGQFAEAKRAALQALDLARAAGDTRLAQRLQEELRRYEAGQPLRKRAPGPLP